MDLLFKTQQAETKNTTYWHLWFCNNSRHMMRNFSSGFWQLNVICSYLSHAFLFFFHSPLIRTDVQLFPAAWHVLPLQGYEWVVFRLEIAVRPWSLNHSSWENRQLAVEIFWMVEPSYNNYWKLNVNYTTRHNVKSSKKTKQNTRSFRIKTSRLRVLFSVNFYAS